MDVDWERLARSAGKLSLLFLEYCIKLSAVVVTAVVLAAKGSFGMKLGTGFGSISPVLRNLFKAPADIVDAADLIHEYNTLTAATFNEQYGADAINGVLTYLHGGITYLQAVHQNFANQPFATFFATLIAFCTLYLISLILRFARQKGQGSYLNRLERKLADRVFETPGKPGVPADGSKPEPSHGPQKKESPPIGKSQKTNKYLRDYMRNAQNGGG